MTTDVASQELLASTITRVMPNPSHGLSRVDYAVAQNGQVRLTVVDLAGRRIATLLNAEQRAGLHSVSWNGDETGKRLPAAPTSSGLRLPVTPR